MDARHLRIGVPTWCVKDARTQGRKPKDARTQGRVRLPPIQLLRNERGLLQTND